MSWRKQKLPEINRLINVGNEIRDFINQMLNISFVRAGSRKCTKSSSNGTVLGGHLGVVQGYLVYKFITVNVENQTGYITLIDAETAMNFTPPSVNQLVR